MNFVKSSCILIQCLILICGTENIQAQSESIDTISSDGLLKAARLAAFDQKNYELAKHYLKKALIKSPNYADIRIFLGRIYSWTDQLDSAQSCFETVLSREPDYEDASLAYADLMYWNNQHQKVIEICNAALAFHTKSPELRIKKAKALAALKQFKEAASITNQLLLEDKKNQAARSLENRIKAASIANKIGISYDYNGFDKQFSDPWHLLSIDYSRSTPIGSVIGRFNYGNRFDNSATQVEIEAYPSISKTFYSYISLGFSDESGIFPKFRGGFSLYANLPKSFEAELGFRYLKFSGTPTWIYTGYLGKYISNWLLGARAYLTPSDFVKKLAVTYNVNARYYIKGADDFIGAVAGYGISPDDRFNNIQLNSPDLKTYKFGLFAKKKLNTHHLLTFDLTWFNQEYLPNTRGNQYLIGTGWQYRF